MSDDGRQSRGRPVMAWMLFLLTLCALGAALWYGRDILAHEAAERASAERRLKEAQARVHALESLNKQEADRAAQAKAEREHLAAEAEKLKDGLEQAEAELARVKATWSSIEEQMQAEIKKGEIRMSEAEGQIRVDLVDKVLFDSGQAELSPRGAEVLTRLAGVLAKVEDRMIQVSGHTDNSPISERLREQFPTNWELSTARAVNVVRHLSETGAIGPRRLLAAGYGEHHPVAANGTPQGRSKNRRIEILLIPALSAKKAGAQTRR